MKKEINIMRLAFLGNMNNMSYMYAKGLRRRGYDVTLFLDVDKHYLLDRPESWEGTSLENNADWIIEPFYSNKNALYRLTFPKLLLRKLIRRLNTYDVVFLNGKWLAIGSFLDKDKKIFGLFAGYDLEVLGNESTVYSMTRDFYNSRYKQIKGLVPQSWVKAFYKKYIGNQINGIRRTNLLSYYAEGISPKGDALIKSIKAGQSYARLQMRGFDTTHFPYVSKEPAEEFVILNTTRFCFLEEREDNKRNDIMLHGIAKFLSMVDAKNVRMIFFKKGTDLAAAQQLCIDLGLEKYIQWYNEVSLSELTSFYKTCDVAFDQLGNQWIGSGLFSMLTGRPLIANAREEIYQQYTHLKSPICQAKNPDEVAEWLMKLYKDPELAKKIGQLSREYVLEIYDLDKTIDFFIAHMS